MKKSIPSVKGGGLVGQIPQAWQEVQEFASSSNQTRRGATSRIPKASLVVGHDPSTKRREGGDTPKTVSHR